MVFSTYNVNSIHARLPVLLRWLDLRSPDVVCLQELKTPQEKFPEEDLLSAGYQSVWVGQKSWNGVAVLAKKNLDIQKIQTSLPGDDLDLQSRYLEVDVAGIRLINLYVPNGNPAPGTKFDYKLQWLDRLLSRTENLMSNENPVILCGDFNIIPEEKDVYKPDRWVNDALFRPEIREVFQKLLRQGWTDVLRNCYPDEIIYTYWDYFRNAFARNAGLRIDHFLVSPQVLPLVEDIWVEKEVRSWVKTSDHAPLVMKLKL